MLPLRARRRTPRGAYRLARFFAGGPFFGEVRFLAALFFGGSADTSVAARDSHLFNSPASSSSAGGSTTYSRIGRPPIGSKTRAPSTARSSARSASPSRTNIEEANSPQKSWPFRNPHG